MSEPASCGRIGSIDVARGLGGFDLHAWLGQSFAVGFWRSLVFALGVVHSSLYTPRSAGARWIAGIL